MEDIAASVLVVTANHTPTMMDDMILAHPLPNMMVWGGAPGLGKSYTFEESDFIGLRGRDYYDIPAYEFDKPVVGERKVNRATKSSNRQKNKVARKARRTAR